MKARVEKMQQRCNWKHGCDGVAGYAVMLGVFGAFGLYCEHHALTIAEAVNDDDARRNGKGSSENSGT